MKIPSLKSILEIRLCSFLRISIFLPVVAACSHIFGYSRAFFAAYTAAVLHELSHILCARLLGVKVSRISLYPFGVNALLKTDCIYSSSKEFCIAFAGPLLNIILFWLSCSADFYLKNSHIRFFADVNLCICAINLVPALPLDGGRMLKSLLTPKFGAIRAYTFSLKLSRILIFVLSALAVLLFFLSGFNFSLILISAFLLQNLSRERMGISRVALKEILENNQKLNRKNPFPTKVFLVKESTPASHIFKLLSYDYYCIFHVADKSSAILNTVTETEVLDGLTNIGITAKFGEIKNTHD